jgi:hypothetical protein
VTVLNGWQGSPRLAWPLKGTFAVGTGYRADPAAASAGSQVVVAADPGRSGVRPELSRQSVISVNVPPFAVMPLPLPVAR